MAKRFRLVRDDGWGRGETIIAEADSLEDLREKLKQKTGA